MRTLRLTSSVLAVIFAVFALFTGQEAEKWPGPGAAGSGRVLLNFEEHGHAVTIGVSEVVAERDGQLMRMVTLSVAGEYGNRADLLLASMENVRLDKAHAVGSSLGDQKISVKPADGYTWGTIYNRETLEIDFRVDRATKATDTSAER